MDDADERFLLRAVELARRSEGHTRPNPPVGAVVVKGGRVVGEGRHRRCGGDHAEVAAMKNAIRRHGAAVLRGATAYVSLEPCSRPGRVGACTEALVAAGVARVVYACTDPNPANKGRAARVLSGAGIRCERAPRESAAAMEGAELLRPFAKHQATGLPYVTVKIAMSLDGKTCDHSGDAKWVSSATARRRTGLMRSRVDVMMVGAETVRRDNPSLLCHQAKNDDLFRAIVSGSGRLPPSAQVFTDCAKDRTLVYRDPVEAVRDLGGRGFLHVLCEGGLKLARSLAEAGLVDEWITVLASKVIGSRPIAKAVPIGRTVCICD